MERHGTQKNGYCTQRTSGELFPRHRLREFWPPNKQPAPIRESKCVASQLIVHIRGDQDQLGAGLPCVAVRTFASDLCMWSVVWEICQGFFRGIERLRDILEGNQQVISLHFSGTYKAPYHSDVRCSKNPGLRAHGISLDFTPCLGLLYQTCP